MSAHQTTPNRVPAAAGYLLALPLVALATVLAVVAEESLHIPNVSLIFVAPVVLLAVWFGWGPSLLAAGAGVLCDNFFLIEPRYTLRVANPANLWGLALLMVVAATVSAVAGQSRRRAMEAQNHAGQAQALLEMARVLVGAPDRAAILQAGADAIARLFGAPAAVLLTDREDVVAQATAHEANLTGADQDAARWALSSRLATRAGAYPFDVAAFDFWPVQTGSRLRAAVGVDFSRLSGGRPVDPDRLVGIVGGHLALALQRDLFAGEAAAAQLQREREQVKADLLAAVSHDLKTPLSTILFTLQSLQRFDADHDAATRAELLALAETETSRLGGLVGNLLDMGRLDAHAVPVRPAPVELAELVAAALARAALAIAGRPVINQAQHAGVAVLVDFGLAETALAAVLENAGKYAAAGAPIEIRWSCESGSVLVEVLDQGPGFPSPVEPLFDRFTRGVNGDGRPPGVGLGLAIARGFLEAQGGAITAGNRDDRLGGKVTLRLPTPAQAPSENVSLRVVA